MTEKETKKDQFDGSPLARGDKVRELKNMIQGKKEFALRDAEDQKTGASKGEENKTVRKGEEKGVEDQIMELESKLKEAEEEIKKTKLDQLHALAELENFRKRMKREKEEVVQYGNSKLIRELLPVLDHLEMTLAHSTSQISSGEKQQKKEKDPLLYGVELTLKQFMDVLKKHGVLVIEGKGELFDPHSQECIGHQESAEFSSDHVISVHRKGYRIGDRVIRPALVTIAKHPPPADEKDQLPQEKKIH